MPDATLAQEGRQFTGTAVVFDTWTQIGSPEYGFRERVAQGSLTKTLRESDVVFLDGHDPLRPISRMSAGTLRLNPEDRGLGVDSDMDTGVSYVSDLARNVDNKLIKGMSFGFRVTQDEWVSGKDGVDERTIRELELIEVSATAFPAYTATDAAVRSAVLAAKCRRGGLTTGELRAIKGMTTRDVDTDTDTDPNALIAAVDAAIDEAIDLHASGEDDQAWALITSADTTIDKVMELLGIPDPDDSEPSSGTRARDLNEPADATRAVAHLALKMQGLAALHGFRKPA
jgi:hypothetical protein